MRSPVPSGPASPSRWPDATTPVAVAAPTGETGAAMGAADPPEAGLFRPAETAARVGDQYIFLGELLGDAQIMIALTSQVDFSELNPQRRSVAEFERDKLVEQLQSSAIDRKLMYIEFLRSIPEEKLQEALANIDSRIGDHFRDSLFDMLDKVNSLPEEEYPTLIRRDARLFRLAYLMKQRKVTSLGQLEEVLRANGSSLEKQQSAFAERMLGQQQMRESIDVDPEITHQEMADYYRENWADFQVPARAKWRQLTIRFSLCKSKQQAGEIIAKLGNEMRFGGTPFAAVAKRSSHGPNREEGGLHDWTEQGSLKISKPIADAVFSIPLNRLSEIIPDAEGLHIVMVLDRTDAHMISFADAQVDIISKLRNQKVNAAIAKYVAKLKERTPVWQ